MDAFARRTFDFSIHSRISHKRPCVKSTERRIAGSISKSFFSLLYASLFLFAGNAWGTPALEVKSYDSHTSFSSVETVLIMKGDDPSYKEPGFDDSGWNLVSLPSDWSGLYPEYNGICWYRMHIKLPDSLPEKSIGVTLGVITDSDELYLNGYKIGGSGKIDGSESAYDKTRLYELPMRYLMPGKDNILSLRVRGIFPYANGPYTGEFSIDSMQNLITAFILKELASHAFVIIYLLVSVYFFLFYAKRREDKENLVFAIFCLAMGLYFLLRTQLKYTIGIPFFIAKKAEYLVLVWLVFLMSEFIILYYKMKHTIIQAGYFIITLAYFFVYIFTNDYKFWDSFNQYIMVPTWLIGVATVFYVLVTRLKRDIDAASMFFSFLIMFGTLVNDVLVNMNLYTFVFLSQYGFFFFIASIATRLSYRFFRLHNEVADLNRNLEQKVTERTDELAKTVRELEAAKRETDNILKNVQEGIFLLDEELRIGGNHSQTLASIFERPSLSGKSLIEILSPLVSEKILSEASDFLNLYLTHPIPAQRLARLNPLEDVPVYFKKADEALIKHLNFAFTRIEGKDSKRFILATVRDITENRLLAKKIRDTEERAELETALILSIIRIKPGFAASFISESREELSKITRALESARFSGNAKSLVRDILARVHALKGNASMLCIERFALKAHEIEGDLAGLAGRVEVEPLDLISLPYGIVALKGILDDMEGLMTVIADFKISMESPGGRFSDSLEEMLRSLVDGVCEREKKKAGLRFECSFEPEAAQGLSFSIKKILVQLVKNAVIHGIETEEVRKIIGKPPSGAIEVSCKKKETGLEIIVRDDGAGIRTSRLRELAKERGLYSEPELETLSDEMIASLVFATGITTRENADIDSGRGIGLDVVKDEIEASGGKITLDYKHGEYTSFKIVLPLERTSITD